MGILVDRLPDCPIRLFLLLENRLVRETLVRLFRKLDDICVESDTSLSEAPGTPELVGAIVVLDNLEAASLLGSEMQVHQPSATPVGLVLVGMENNEEQFLAAVRVGVSGYLLNDASANDVVAAVRAVASGEAVCPPHLCMALFRSVVRTARETPMPARRGPVHGLTLRQQQLISLVAKGLTNKEIASQLHLSEFTIKNHMHRIMKQVEAESRHEVVDVARASGYHWITSPA